MFTVKVLSCIMTMGRCKESIANVGRGELRCFSSWILFLFWCREVFISLGYSVSLSHYISHSSIWWLRWNVIWLLSSHFLFFASGTGYRFIAATEPRTPKRWEYSYSTFFVLFTAGEASPCLLHWTSNILSPFSLNPPHTRNIPVCHN